MDPKEVKSLLKQAREALKEKEYKTALKHCKAILKSDKNNYNAWVFIGAAAQELNEPDQSEAAFKRAIEISPVQLLAWQGLCNFYEKQDKKECKLQLIAVYKKIIELQSSEKNKNLEITEKLISVVRNLGDKDEILKGLVYKLELLSGEEEQTHIVYKDIFDELVGETDLNDYKMQLQADALNKMLLHPSFTNDCCSRLFATCIEPLYKNGHEEHSVFLAHQIYEKYPENPSCLEFLCRHALATLIYKGIVIDDIKQMSEKLKLCEITKGLSCIIDGLVLFIEKKYSDAVLQLSKGLKSIEYCVEGWFLVANSQLLLHQYQESERSTKTGLQIATKSKASPKVIGKFCLILGQALTGKQNWDSAFKAFEKCFECLGRSVEILKAFSYSLLKIGQLDKAEKICEELRAELGDHADVLQLEGYALFLRQKYDEALQKLRQSVSKAESPLTLHLVALVLWESEQWEKSFKVFIKAAELDPYYFKNFLYLGHYYLNHLYDKSKACLCYQKAFHLDSSDYECGLVLSKVLKDLGKEDENLKVLKTITEQASLGSCKWAWTQLGLYHLEKSNVEEAIISLQNAVRADPNNSYSWECLGDAYLKRGSHESALKSFDRASELNSTAMYPLYQVSTIQKMRGFYVEAIEKFKSLLNIVPSYIPALIGLAETWILLSKRYFVECLYGLARDCCQEALQVLAKVAIENKGLSSLWKLAGDACTIPFNLDDKWFPISIPPELQLDKKADVAVVCQKPQLLISGSKFYGHALSLKDNVSSLWHDLGINYHFQSKLPSCGNNVDLAKKAFICMQKAVSISPMHCNHWTALGVLALGKEIQDYAFGQHSLIKSLEINENNAEAWTNLGVLYLENGDIKLAHKAFKKAQSVEPIYPLSWIGQAFIADKVQHVETMDLYRHATTLGSHSEALLGYARSVCQTLLNALHKDTDSYKFDIEQMNAVVAALDCAVKYIANNYNCAEAFNILGILYERQGIYTAALRAYERALELFEPLGKIDDIEKVRTNYARTLSIMGKTDESLKQFLLLKKVDITLLCSFASALFKASQFEKAYKLFKQAFEMSENPSEKSHIKVAMAMVATNLQGSEYPKPLTLLLESSQIECASVPGLLALCAHGMLKGEKALAFAAEMELIPYKFNKDYSTDIAFLRAAKAYLLNGAQAARNELLKMIHCQPDNALMWMQMAQYLLLWNREYANMAAHCTKVGVFHNGNKEAASQIFALCQISAGYRKGALAAAQKAVHISPEKLSNWTTLAAACHVADKDREHTGWLFSFVRGLAKKQGIKPELLGWLVVMEAFHHISSENMSFADSLIKQGLSISSFGPETQSTLQILASVVEVFLSKGKIDPLVIALKNNPKSFLGWHILCQLLISSGRFTEAEKTLSQFVTIAEKFFPKWTTFPLLQLTALSYQAIHSDPENPEKWLSTGETAVAEAVKISLSNQAARFLQGILAVESGNDNLAKRSFERVLLNPSVKEEKWMEKVSRHLYVPLCLKKKNDKDALKEVQDKFPNDKELIELVMKSVETES